jgi:type III secretion protein R
VDLVVSNVLLALGLTQLSPTSVALPFKLLLFVAVDGWKLLARALALSYAG